MEEICAICGRKTKWEHGELVDAYFCPRCDIRILDKSIEMCTFRYATTKDEVEMKRVEIAEKEKEKLLTFLERHP